MAFEEDLSAYFRTEDFGVAVSVRGRTLHAIFDAQYQEQLGVSGSGPALTCATEHVADVRRDEVVTVGADSYRVVAVEPDGTGITVLRLQRA